MLRRLAWLVLAAMIVVAVARGIPANPGLWADWGSAQAADLAGRFEAWLAGVDLGDYERIVIGSDGKWDVGAPSGSGP